MRDYIELETSPYNEPGVQVSDKDDYMPAMRREAQIFKRQLLRMFGPPPATVSVSIKSNPHDFGSYLSIKVSFNDTDEEGAMYAYNLEDNCPGDWDEIAKEELAISLDQQLPEMRQTIVENAETGKIDYVNYWYAHDGRNVGKFVPKEQEVES